MPKQAYLLCVLFVWLLGGCFNNGSNLPGEEDGGSNQTEENQDVEEDQDETSKEIDDELQSLEDVAHIAILALKNQDFTQLLEVTHPSKGLLFSPYGYIDVENAQVFTSEEVKELPNDRTDYLWGYFDGSGDPIELTFADYYHRFVYDEDFMNAPEQSMNKRLGQGNSLDNSKEVFPNASVIEYHYPGFDPQYDGMDWRSLRLVIVEEKNEWHLVGIIHDEWTI